MVIGPQNSPCVLQWHGRLPLNKGETRVTHGIVLENCLGESVKSFIRSKMNLLREKGISLSRRFRNHIDNDQAFDPWLGACVEHLREGGIAILPTETGYMMAVHGLNKGALDHLYVSKGRPSGRATHLAVDSVERGQEVISLSLTGETLLKRFSPGPLTVIGSAMGHVPKEILGQHESLGIRIPDHPLTLEVLRRFGAPLTATSANMAGQVHEVELERILEQFSPDAVEKWFLLEDDHRAYEIPSTMILQEGESFKVLREGSISEEELHKALFLEASSRD
jgi:L-threonylcarbamoyladenylate synthase